MSVLRSKYVIRSDSNRFISNLIRSNYFLFDADKLFYFVLPKRNRNIKCDRLSMDELVIEYAINFCGVSAKWLIRANI